MLLLFLPNIWDNLHGNVINGRFLIADIVLSRHRLRHRLRHGDGFAGRSHRQQLRCEAGDWVKTGQTVDGKPSAYRGNGSRDSPSDTP